MIVSSPRKDIRRAMMVAKGLARDATETPLAQGGRPYQDPYASVQPYTVQPYVASPPPAALRQAIDRFAHQRRENFRPPVAPVQEVAPGQLSHQQLRVEAPMPPPRPQGLGESLGKTADQTSDLGKTLQTGYDMLTGKPETVNERDYVMGRYGDPYGEGDVGIHGNLNLIRPQTSGKPYAGTMSPAERDMLIRTVYGEAADQGPIGQAAVAHVILNRAQDNRWGTKGLGYVMYQPGAKYQQFSTWNPHDPAGMNARKLSPGDPAYQEIGRIVDGVSAGKIGDPTNGAVEFYAPAGGFGMKPGTVPSWAPQEAAQNDITIGGHRFLGRGNFDLNEQPSQVAGPTAQNAPASAPAPEPPRLPSGAHAPDAQGLFRVPNRDGSFTLTDSAGNAVGYDIGTAPLSAAPGPRSEPVYPPAPTHNVPDQPLHESSLGPSDNQGQQAVPNQDQSQPPPSQGNTDPMSNLYNKVALAPEVNEGWQNFQAEYQPAANRGGHIVEKALRLTRRKRATGGTDNTTANTNPGIIPEAAINEMITPMALSGDSSFPAGGGPISDQQIAELLSFSTGTNIPFTGTGPAPASSGPNVVNSPYNPPAPPSTYTPPSNSSITGPAYQNTLNQVLGTNSPTMQEVFGFNYPQIPPPQPNIYAQPQATTMPSGSYSAPSTGSSGSATNTISQGAFLPGAGGYGGGYGGGTGGYGTGYGGYGGFGGLTPTGPPPLLTNPPPIQTINGVPSIMPPLIPSGSVGNYSNFNPNPISSAQIPMATPWANNIGMPLAAAKGGSIKEQLYQDRRGGANYPLLKDTLKDAQRKTFTETKDVTLPNGKILPNRQLTREYYTMPDGRHVTVHDAGSANYGFEPHKFYRLEEFHPPEKSAGGHVEKALRLTRRKRHV